MNRYVRCEETLNRGVWSIEPLIMAPEGPYLLSNSSRHESSVMLHLPVRRLGPGRPEAWPKARMVRPCGLQLRRSLRQRRRQEARPGAHVAAHGAAERPPDAAAKLAPDVGAVARGVEVAFKLAERAAWRHAAQPALWRAHCRRRCSGPQWREGVRGERWRARRRRAHTLPSTPTHTHLPHTSAP